MNNMSDRFIEQFLILAGGIGWSLLFFLGKKMLNSIEEKIETSLKEIASAQESIRDMPRNYEIKIEKSAKIISKSLAKRIDKQCDTCNRMFVTRQEFGAFTATINHKIDSIYQLLKRKGIQKV